MTETEKLRIQRESLEFLKNENQWPHWPICPVKRTVEGNSWPKCGLVHAGGTTVRILNMFAGWTPEQFDAAEKYSYDSLEELVDDGWIVD